MKKHNLLVVLPLLVATACSGTDIKNEKKLYVIATDVPHGEILEAARPLLKAKGYSIKIISTDDYYFPNPAVAKGSADANYFQHKPFLDKYNAAVRDSEKLEALDGIHIEPIGFYSNTPGYSSLDDLKDGDHIIFSDNEAEYGRGLLLLQANGVITLKNGGTYTSDFDDITSNPKNIVFDHVQPNALITAYNAKTAPVILINGNFILGAGKSPHDAIALEGGADSPYANFLAVLPERKTLPKIVALNDVLKSQTIKDFITSKYADGSVIPA